MATFVSNWDYCTPIKCCFGWKLHIIEVMVLSWNRLGAYFHDIMTFLVKPYGHRFNYLFGHVMDVSCSLFVFKVTNASEWIYYDLYLNCKQCQRWFGVCLHSRAMHRSSQQKRKLHRVLIYLWCGLWKTCAQYSFRYYALSCVHQFTIT